MKKTKKRTVEYKVAFSKLKFEQGYIAVIYNNKYCIYRNYKIRDCNYILKQIYSKLSEEDQVAIKTTTLILIIDTVKETFSFKYIDIINYINRLKETYLKDETHLENELEVQRGNKVFETKVERSVSFSSLIFSRGSVSIRFKRKQYFYRDRRIRDYDKIIESIYSRASKAIKKYIRETAFLVIIDINEGVFSFKDEDIIKFVNNLKDIVLPDKEQIIARKRIRLNAVAKEFNVSYSTIQNFLATKGFMISSSPNTKLTDKMYELLVDEFAGKKSSLAKSSMALKSISLRTQNIRFFNGYYMIFQTKNGRIQYSIAPFKVVDSDSYEILNYIHKYFEQIFEQKHIIVKHNEVKIVEPSKVELIKLGDYIRFLKRKVDTKGEWWAEVQNVRKLTLKQCYDISAKDSKKKASLKNGYIDSLVSMQSEIKLIPVYEINHGKKEAAFIFTINMSNNKRAIIFENATIDTATTTWVFITKVENYEQCINLVFDYFTDYSISAKRSSLHKNVNPPESFKAENYSFIDHDDLGWWLKKLNSILEQKSEPSEIQFISGLHVPRSSETRSGHNETITTRDLHNQLMRKLYDKLCKKNGKDNVGTEIHVGTKRIDAVVKRNGFFDLYEVKTADNPSECVTEALGQLMQYAYLYCPNKIGKMVIVGLSEPTKDVEKYLLSLREKHSLQLYYMKV